MNTLLRAGAMALGLLFCVPVSAQVGSSAQCEALDASGNCVPGHVLIDPVTGQPYKASGGTGPGGGDPSYTATTGSTTVPTSVAETGGWDGSAVRRFLTDTSGRQIVTVTSLPSIGLGAMAAVPAGSTNGTVLGTLPAGGTGARLYLASGDSVTFTVAATAPSSAPTSTFTISQSSTGPNWDENLAGGQMIYVTAVTGSPKFRWF